MPMPSSLRASTLALLAALAFAMPATAADLQLILVRHAEKADDGTRDPALSEAGQARAQALAKALQDAGVQAVYATPYKRTRMTAAPLATAAGTRVTVRDIVGDVATDAATFASELREKHPGSVVVIVGHSNTIAPLANALLGRQALQDLGEHEYDRMLVVTLPDDAPPRLVEARYGAASQAH